MAGGRRAGVVLRLDAWAKVNLTLHVVGRRADGYHELDSLVVFAGVGDTLEISPASALRLSIDGPFASGLERTPANLVVRAARALRARYQTGATRLAGARLRLTKRLPVGAGIGGGSSDAAAALRGLNQFWGLRASARELHGVAAALGADVPVCLSARPSYLGGIGERVDPAPPLPPAWLVLVNPGVPLATGAVFEARDGPYSPALRRIGAPGGAPGGALGDTHALARYLMEGRNDLEPVARRLVPAIGETLAVLRDVPHCLLARMSGSGATCFGLFADQEAASLAAARIGAARPAWWVSAAPLLSE